MTKFDVREGSGLALDLPGTGNSLPSPQVLLQVGDCTDLLRELPDRSIGLVLADPPHGRTQCDWDRIIPFEPLWEQFRRVLTPDGAVLIHGTQPFTSLAITSNLEWFRYCWIWEKSKATGWLDAKRRPMAAHEEIIVFAPAEPRYFPQMRPGRPYDKGLTKVQTENDVYGKHKQVVVKSTDGLRYPRSVLYFKTAESEGPTYHKSQKPVALLSYLIRTHTRPGETVLDPCMGSASTGVAAIETGRRFIGFEKDPGIYQTAAGRIASCPGYASNNEQI